MLGYCQTRVGKERRMTMFGKMNVEPFLQVASGTSVDAAAEALVQEFENTEIARWFQFPGALLLFLLIKDDPASGVVYVLDRRTNMWLAVDFEDEAYGGYRLDDFETLRTSCRFFDLVERPGRLRHRGGWFLQPGFEPRRLVSQSS
jgi:hypothetical protein